VRRPRFGGTGRGSREVSRRRRRWWSSQFNLYQSPYGKLFSLFMIGMKWMITLICLGTALGIAIYIVYDTADTNWLHAHGTRATAEVVQVSGGRSSSYRLTFNTPYGPDQEWTSNVAGSPTVGDHLTVLYDADDPSDLRDVRVPVNETGSDIVFGLAALLALGLGIMFLRMTPEEVSDLAKARIGR
jgi:hypothetical protein